MGRIFGTDGVRGIANGDLSIELAMNLGRAAGMVVEETIGRQPTFLLGMDTRLSGDMLESAMAAGLCSAGANVKLLGVVPTPAVAYLVRLYGADAGIMLSASHNPYDYNGIKIFSGEGYKLLDAQEDEIEQIVLDHVKPYSVKAAHEIGRVSTAPRAVEDYVTYLASTAEGHFDGLRVAVDCANGSASVTAPLLFDRLGVDADFYHEAYDGRNINDRCGSTHIGTVAEIVRRGGYDLGLAFDGDADRLLVVDENGETVDGDRLMAMFAYDMKRRGKLKNNTLVATVMSNLGLFKFGEQSGVALRAAKVGDRYVLEEMRAGDFNLGGEQSGHIIFLDYMTTGDGQLSAVQLLNLLRDTGEPLSKAASLMRVYPQTLLNITATAEMKRMLEDEELRRAIDARSEQLEGNGRVLVRPSGTEPLIRVMVEGPEVSVTEAVAREIAELLQKWKAPCGAGV